MLVNGEHMEVFNFLLKGFGFGDDKKIANNNGQVNVNLKPTQLVPQNTQSVKPISEEKKEINANNLVVYAPKNNDEIYRLVDCLKKGEPIIIDLSNMNKTDVQRIIDYLNGALQALSGTINRLQGNLFVLTPRNVNITTI